VKNSRGTSKQTWGSRSLFEKTKQKR